MSWLGAATELAPETIPQRGCASDQSLDGLDRIAKSLEMREKPARFDGHHEAGRRLAAPGRECRRFGKPVEGIVDFDGIERLRVVTPPLVGREVAPIERPAPGCVIPSGTANPQRGRVPPCRVTTLRAAPGRAR
jgi:hypothetical protein